MKQQLINLIKEKIKELEDKQDSLCNKLESLNPIYHFSLHHELTYIDLQFDYYYKLLNCLYYDNHNQNCKIGKVYIKTVS